MILKISTPLIVILIILLVIILVVVAIIAGYLLFIWQTMSNLKGGSGMNPITSITTHGIMGIEVGDQWKMVLSRLLHLKLVNKQKFRELHNEMYDMEANGESVDFRFLIPSDFNNIDNLIFDIHDGKLKSISFHVFPQQADIEFLMDKIIRIIEEKQGKPGTLEDGCLIWTESGIASKLAVLRDEHLVLVLSTNL